MTNRSGDVVQHYGYTAFGHERYQHNTAAFDVTNRYTGQQIDDETGLYFYQSRYYDAQLGRFTQADTIVPSADTSQALNSYAYVANNPLKFTDPSGHGWFSDLWDDIKGFIGTILTVALTPWLGPIAAIIGSAVGTLVNGGTWKSFAIGIAIGMAAGAIAGGMGFEAPDMFAAGFKFTTETIMQGVVAGAVTGAVAGAISSAVYGGNWGTNIGQGAMGGAIGAGIAMATKAIGTWVKGMSATEEYILVACLDCNNPGQVHQLGDKLLWYDGELITPGAISEAGQIDDYIAYLNRVNKKFQSSDIDWPQVGKTLADAGVDISFFSTLSDLSHTSANVIQLGYAYWTNRVARTVADGLIGLKLKFYGKSYRGWVRIQPKVYSRGYLWFNKGWRNNGDAYWVEAKNNSWEFYGYSTPQGAQNAIFEYDWNSELK